MERDRHWVRPIRGRIPTSRHVLLWCETERLTRKRDDGILGVRLKRIIPTLFELSEAGVSCVRLAELAQTEPNGSVILDNLEPFKRYTIWLARGWQDLVLSGLTAALEDGTYQWQWISIDGAHLTARGTWHGKRMDFCSLANWTGGSWDNWADKLWECSDSPIIQEWQSDNPRDLAGASSQEILAIASVHSILYAICMLGIGDARTSAAAQGRQWWRAWGGPVVTATGLLVKGKRRKGDGDVRYYVAPIPDRPDSAANAERHCCYGLTREQYRRGRIEGPVYVLDVKAAYLSSICSMIVPVRYKGPLDSRAASDAVRELDGNVGLALCCVRTDAYPLPFRRGPSQGRATGVFWTWLAGADLDAALYRSEVLEIYGGWVWTGTILDDSAAAAMCQVAGQLRDGGAACCVPAWRSIYSALVGSFAQWDRTWVDTPAPSQFGPWSTWTYHSPASGELTQYRAIGGRVQYREDRGDHSRSVPLLYACVLANLRCRLSEYAAAVGQEDCYAMTSDALWLSERGYDRLVSALRNAPARQLRVSVSAIFDRAWFDGKGKAVVEKDGLRYPLLAGVPHHVSIGDDGAAKWYAADPWSGCVDGPEPGRVTMRQKAFQEKGVVTEHDYPAVMHSPWRNIVDNGLVEELLLPLRPPTAREGERRTNDGGAV